MKISWAVTCVALAAAGCAVRPLPEQATGVSTFNIVKQIRCETREAIFDTLVKGLINSPLLFDASARSIAQRFEAHPEMMDQFKPALFKGEARDFVNFFWNTGIAYNFTLDMTETNNIDAQVDLLRTLSRSTWTLGLKSGLDRSRENTRTFTITDDFKGLLNLKPSDYCEDHIAANENLIYPITGKIGIKAFIQEFVNIALFTNLDVKDGGTAPTMVDTLQFQTKLSGSAVPKVVVSPIGRGVQLADASLTADLSRNDIHTLTMGLSVVAATPAEEVAGSKALFGRLLTSTGGGTRRVAAEAVDQELTRQALRRPIAVTNTP